MKTRLIIVIKLLLAIFAIESQGINMLTTILCHQVPVIDNKPNIELGSLKFYFTQQPVITELQSTSNKDMVQKIFFFPNAEINNSAEKTISEYNAASSPMYNIHIEPVVGPAKGIRLVIDYNAQKVAIHYRYFESITLEKGIMFHFFNTSFLEKLRLHNKPIVHIASYENKRKEYVL